jgi:PAS domain S-box-containing protein
MAANLFEAAEANDVSRAQLVGPLGLDAAALVDPSRGIDWDTLVEVLQRLSEILGGNVDRLRAVGRAMASVPSFALFQRVSRAVVSLRSLYLAGERWIAPANVPHLVLKTAFPGENRLSFRCRIPEPYAPSAPYLHIFEGLLCEVPRVLGLPPATILRSTVTPRELDILLALPPSDSVMDRLKRVTRAALHQGAVNRLLEAQRREIAEGLEAAKRSTAEIVTLFDRLPNLVVIHRRGKIVWANRAAAHALGHREATDLVERSFVEIFHASSRAIGETLSSDPIDENAPDHIEAELVSCDGTRVVVEIAPAQAVAFGGKEARLFVAHNVTERKRLQQQLSISDRLAAVGMLAAGVAHEVNNPLAYVLNNIEIARRELRPLGDRADASRDALTVALEGVDRIRTIIHELLALARIDDNSIGAIDVAQVVESTLALAKPHIEDRATLECSFTPAPRVRGTASRVGQVLLNLVANALEAMTAKERAESILRVTVEPNADGGAVLEVSDTGVGIPPENAARIFEPFFSTKSLGTGTGLGLAISQRLVSEMGGVLSFESTLGVGTTFRMTLAP